MVVDRFVVVGRAAGAEAGDLAVYAVGAELLARWSEPHRRYHTVAHLVACLDLTESEPVAALAMWGHDAVYDPRSGANEERSAQLMCSLLTRCSLPTPVIAEVARLIRLTAGHATEPGDQLGTLLADADLAVLARTEADYDSYVEQVRAEYAHVPDELWRIGRAAVLRGLLDLPQLYRLHPEWEQRARANLSRELAMLAA